MVTATVFTNPVWFDENGPVAAATAMVGCLAADERVMSRNCSLV